MDGGIESIAADVPHFVCRFRIASVDEEKRDKSVPFRVVDCGYSHVVARRLESRHHYLTSRTLCVLRGLQLPRAWRR